MFKSFLVALGLTAAFISPSSYAYNELKDVKLTIYINPSNPPFATLSNDYKTSVGLDIDIIKELQRRLGFTLKEDRIYPLLITDILKKMENGECDMVGGSLSITKKRSQYMHFTPIYFDSGLGILYSTRYNKDKIKTHEDLDGKKVAVISDTSATTFLESQGTKVTVSEYRNFTRAALAVAYGKVDALIYDKPILETFANDMKRLELAVTDDIFLRESAQYAFAMPKDSPYAEYIDKEIQNMIYDGTMYTLITKYFD